MKKNILLLLSLLSIITVNSTIQARDVNVTKNKNNQSLKVGDKLNLNSATEFTKTNDDIYYKTIKSGSGKSPYKGENLTVHYTGWTLVSKMNDKKQIEFFVGPKFDSSYDRNQTFQFKLGMRQVISGWDKMLATMKVGEKRIVVLPSKEAYGSRATGNIAANSSLIFEIEFISAA